MCGLDVFKCAWVSLSMNEHSQGNFRNTAIGIFEREYFDVEGAAEFLGCTLGDVWHYVRHRDGLLRVAL